MTDINGGLLITSPEHRAINIVDDSIENNIETLSFD